MHSYNAYIAERVLLEQYCLRGFKQVHPRLLGPFYTEFVIAYRLSPIAIIEGNFILYGICYRRPGYRGDQSEKSIWSVRNHLVRVKLSFLKVRVQNLQLSCLLRSIWKANGVSALSNKIWQSWDPIGQAITSGTSGDNYRKQNRGATIKMHRR